LIVPPATHVLPLLYPLVAGAFAAGLPAVAGVAAAEFFKIGFGTAAPALAAAGA